MKINNRFFVYLSILMGLILTLTNSCDKDDSIVKKDVIISWTNPTDITLPTALSTIQLNATADIPGTFTYTPPIGTVLSIGTAQNLKVDFTPTDAVNYNLSTKTVIINVKGSGTVTDYDGNVYNTVVIGTQTWMVENLKVTHYRNGEDIPNVTDNTQWAYLTTGAYCNYNNDVSNSTTYGRLYNWYSVNDSRKIAPIGWHVPTDIEWSTLTTYLGGESVAGGKMKETGTTHWTSPNTGAFNSSGFTALPGGKRYSNGPYDNLSYHGYWWSDTKSSTYTVWLRNMGYESSAVNSSVYVIEFGLSIRCLLD